MNERFSGETCVYIYRERERERERERGYFADPFIHSPLTKVGRQTGLKHHNSQHLVL